MSVLGRIVARTRDDVQERERRIPMHVLQAMQVQPRRDFYGALSTPSLGLIAEFKPSSPSRGVLRSVKDMPLFAVLYEQRASAVSVLCDAPFFGGGYHLMASMRSFCQRPILCKDFIVGEYQILEARAYGADAVLLIAAMHDVPVLRSLLALVHELGMQALFEIHTESEVEKALVCGARIIGINSRDLTTLAVDTSRFVTLRQYIPSDCIVVAESGIQSRAQVDALRSHFNAALIGTSFMTASDPAAHLAELGW